MLTRTCKDPDLEPVSTDSKPVLVTDGIGGWWVEDPPTHSRLMKVDSKEKAKHLWSVYVKSVQEQENEHVLEAAQADL